MHLGMYVYMHLTYLYALCLHVRIDVRLFACLYVPACDCISVYVCMHICIHVHTHTVKHTHASAYLYICQMYAYDLE